MPSQNKENKQKRYCVYDTGRPIKRFYYRAEAYLCVTSALGGYAIDSDIWRIKRLSHTAWEIKNRHDKNDTRHLMILEIDEYPPTASNPEGSDYQ